jgi:hypothetical protein
MPTFHQGDMMSVFESVDHFIVLCASHVRSDGTATMLDHAAGQLAELHPSIPAAVGKWLKEDGHDCNSYGLRCNTKVGLFQHVVIPRHGTNLGCVSQGARMLKELAEANPDKTYALDAPGKGEPWFLVKELLMQLPENVQLWNSSHP